jgi:hypothetical protein
MVDEFDKAPTEVVCVLKGLLEDGEILLADGERTRLLARPTLLASTHISSVLPASRVCACVTHHGCKPIASQCWKRETRFNQLLSTGDTRIHLIIGWFGHVVWCVGTCKCARC